MSDEMMIFILSQVALCGVIYGGLRADIKYIIREQAEHKAKLDNHIRNHANNSKSIFGVF